MAKNNYLQLKGDAWQKSRMRTLVRDDFCCQAYQLGVSDTPCSENRLKELQVHHIQMRVHGGSHELENLVTLCIKHHEDLHPWMKFQMAMDKKNLAEIKREL